MPYNIEMPDGTVVEDIPDSMDPREVKQRILAARPELAGGTPPRPGIINEMKRGAKSLLSDTVSGLGIAGGQESARKAATEGLARSEQIAKEHGETPWERVKKVYNDPKGGLLSAVGEGISQMPAAIAGQAPQLAVTAGAAKLGAMAGAPLGPMGSLVGGGAAAALSMFPQFTGGAMQTQAQEDIRAKRPVDIDIPAALAAAAGSSALEVGGGALALGRSAISSILKIPAKTVTEQAARASAKLAVEAKRSLLGAGARGVGRGLAVEMPVELAQTVMDRAQAGLSLVDDEAMAAYGDTLGSTALVAPALGAAGRIHSRSSARAQVEEQEKAARDAAELAAEQQAAAAEQQKEVQRKDPAYAAQVAQTYRDTEAKYRSMLPPKLPKGADEATKVEHNAQAKLAKEFLEGTLKPQIAEYLKVKPVLQAQQAQQQAAAPQPGTPEEEAGLLFPVEGDPTGPRLSLPLEGRAKGQEQIPVPENYGGPPTADMVAKVQTQLAEQAQALDVHVESLRDQAAKAETPEDSLRVNKLFTQAQTARAQVQQQLDELPKAPKNVDLAKQLENANKAWLKAKEEGDPEAAARAALRIQKAKAAGADLMKPGPGMEMVPAGGVSEAAGDFNTRVAAQQRAGDAAQARLGTVESEEGQDTQPLFDHPADVEARRKAAEAAAAAEKQRKTDAEVTAMGERPLDTSRTAQTSLLDDTEAPVRIQQGKSDMGVKTRAELVADLQIANVTQNDEAIELAKEGLRDLKARNAAEKAATIGGDTTTLSDAGRTAEALAGTRMPGNVAKQQAARDAMHRAYGNMVMILNRFNKGRAKQEELDQARAQVLENLAEDIATSRGAPLTKPELLTLQQEAGQLLNDLQTRFGDTRDVINFGTKKDPDMGPVQERDGTFIRDKFERQLGVKNEQSRRPGRQTFRNPHAAAMTIKEGLEKLRADAVNGKRGPNPTAVTATKKTTSPEDLEAALARAKSSPLVERLRDSLPAFAVDPDRRNLAAEWLYKESIGQKNDVGAEVAAELDRLEAGKRSDEVVQDDIAPDTELQGTIFATKEEFDAYLAGDAVAEMRDAYQRIENAMMSIRVADAMPALDAKIRNAEKNVAAAEESRAVDAADKVKEAALALQTLQDEKVRLIELTNRAPAPTMSRVAADTRATQVELEKLQVTLTRLQAQHTEMKQRQGEDARKTEARLQKATDKLQELIRDRIVVKMEPLRAREADDLAELQKAYAEIAAIEAKIRDNLVHFAGKFPDGDSVEVLADEWHALGVDYRLALDEEMANGTDMDFFSAGPVIEAHAARDEALVKLMSALVNDLQYTPDTRTILAFLNKGAQLEIDLRDAVARMNEAAQQVKVTQDNMRMLPATSANAARKTKAGKALQAEMADATTQAEEIAARDKTMGEIAKTIRSISDAVAKATQEINAAKADTLAAQKARTGTGVLPDNTQEQAAAERREENDRLERMAAMPGENVKFTDMQAVADAFIALPKEVAKLEAKAADTALSKTTRAKARQQLKNAQWKLKNLTGLLSEDATVVAAARDAAKVQIDWLNDKVGAKRIAINEDGITDSVRNSRKEELKKLRQEMQSLQRFVAEFDTKVTRTPIETAAERQARLSTPPPDTRGVKGTSARATQRMAELQATIEDETATDDARAAARDLQQRMMGAVSPEVEAEIERMQAIVDNEKASPGARRIAQNNIQLLREGRLSLQKKGPLTKKKVTPPKTLNRITQSGQVPQPSGVAAQRAAVRDTAFENAMLKLSEIEALQEKNDTALAQAEEAGDTAKAKKFTAFAERLVAAQAQAQAAVDASTTGRRKKKASTPVAEDGEGVASPAPRVSTDLSDASVEAIKDGRVLDVIDRLASEGSTPEVREAAAKLKPFMLRTKLRTQANLRHKGARVAGMYYHDTNTVALDPDSLSEETLLHELTHAATMQALEMPDANLTPDQRTAKAELVRLHKAIQKNPAFKGEYGATDLAEFVAEAYSNPQLQAKLDTIGTPRSLWARVKDLFARILGYGTDPKTPTSRKAKDAVEKLMQASRPKAGGTARAAPTTSSTGQYALSGMIAKKKPWKERMGGGLARLAEMSLVDMRAPLRDALATGNKKLGEDAMYLLRKNDARMPHVYAVFQKGALGMRKDAKGRILVEAGNSKSVQDVFQAIEKIPGANADERMEKAQIYLAAIRAQADPRAAFALSLGKVTPEQMAADLKKLTTEPKQKEALENVRKVYGDLNRGLVGFLEQTGAISKEDAARYTSSDAYVPFYRVRADGVAELVFDETKTVRLGDVRTQPYLKALEGGDGQMLPLNEAITRNVMLLTDMGMRNLTTRNVAYALQDIGKGAKKMQIKTGDGPANVKALRFKQDGNPYHVIVDTDGTAAEGIPSDMVARSLEGTYTVLPTFLKAFGYMGDVLRAGVTRSPLYVGRQLFRDPFAASFTGGLDRGPLSAVAKAMSTFAHQSANGPSKTAEAMIRKGIIQSGIFTGDPDDISKMSLQLAGNDTGAIRRLFNMADRAAMRADSVTREQLYEDTLRRTGSEQQAEMAAMEMMNFHKRGLSPSVQYASRLIPFFNAQIQGLNVLHKAATGKATMQERLNIQNKFWERASLLMASSMIYALAMEDDETYKNARPQDRYGNWFAPLSKGATASEDVTLKLPIPFEVGVFFKALPEAFIDMARGQFGAEEFKAMRNVMLNQIPGYSSFWMPQAVKPLIEVATNYSFFTGREIEGAGMQKVDPQERYTARTTELAKRLSELAPAGTGPSPVMIEHLARGFLGSLPLAGAAMLNSVFEVPNAEKPARKLTETPLLGTAFQDRYGGGQVDILYAKIRAADQAKATFDKMKKEGRLQDAKMYMADVENLRALPMLQLAETRLQQLSAQEKVIRLNTSASAERKRELLDGIAAKREAESRKFLTAVSAVSR